MAIEDIVVERVGTGGGNKVDSNGDVVAKEESNTIIGAIGEVEARWTKMSMIGREETNNT